MKTTVVLAVLIGITTQNAQAGVSPPVISGTYYEQNGINCSDTAPSSSNGSTGQSSGGTAPGTYATSCQLLFSAPPSGKQLRLSTVACTVESRGAQLKAARLLQNIAGSLTREHALAPTLLGTHQYSSGTPASAWFYGIGGDVGGYLVTAPVRVVVDAPEGTYFQIRCQLVGTLQNPP